MSPEMNEQTVEIREMRDIDLPRVSQIVCAGYRWLAGRAGFTPEELDRLVSRRGSEQAIRSQSLEYRFLVASKADLVVGVVAIKKNEVTKLYVDAEFHRQGIGAALFRAAEEIIEQDGHKELFLGAFPSSVPFYEAIGLRISSTQVKHCGLLAGRQCAIMKKTL
jgi:ribosomal protein S18 acetylase RimI-like enzyme